MFATFMNSVGSLTAVASVGTSQPGLQAGVEIGKIIGKSSRSD